MLKIQRLSQPVFVTGNANKLREVKAILAADSSESPIEVTAQAVDGKLGFAVMESP